MRHYQALLRLESDVAKRSHPPFGAVREGGYVYGRGALDDKDNLTAGLIAMLLLKRLGRGGGAV